MTSPRASVWIAATARSGSSLLCEAIASTGVAGRPWEYLYEALEPMWRGYWELAPDVPYRDFVGQALVHGSTPNGVFGAKVMMGYLCELTSRLAVAFPEAGRDLPPLTQLAALCPNPRWIWITRRDKVRQALSLARALQTQAWHAGVEPQGMADYDFAEIDRCLQVVALHEAGWQDLFTAHGLVPFVVVYEDFVQRYHDTTAEILEFLGLPRTAARDLPAPTIMKRQADELSERWRARFLAEKQARQGVTTGLTPPHAAGSYSP